MKEFRNFDLLKLGLTISSNEPNTKHMAQILELSGTDGMGNGINKVERALHIAFTKEVMSFRIMNQFDS